MNVNVRSLLSSLKLSGQCRHVCKCQTNSPNVQLLNEYTLNYFFFEITSLIWKRLHCRWTAAKFTITIGAYVLWNRRNLYCVIPAMTRDRNLHGLIRETVPYLSRWRQSRVTEYLFDPRSTVTKTLIRVTIESTNK